MVYNRAIPCLLLHKGGLYKTVQFKKHNYIGDPINAVKIFNEKEVDEIIFLDIDATVKKREPDYGMIEDIASECFMPLCYGGGIKTIDQMKRLFSLGIEKISLSSIAVEKPEIVSKAAKIFGSQSVVVTVDVKKSKFGSVNVFTHNGKIKTGFKPVDFVKYMEEMGAGEIVVNSIDNDGMMKGYDLELLKMITSSVNIPVVALGGAGKIEDLGSAINQGNASAAAAGSMFVYHGPLRGVLINYPKYEDIQKIFNR